MEDNACGLEAVSEMSHLCATAVHEHVRMNVHGLTLIDYFFVCLWYELLTWLRFSHHSLSKIASHAALLQYDSHALQSSSREQDAKRFVEEV